MYFLRTGYVKSILSCRLPTTKQLNLNRYLHGLAKISSACQNMVKAKAFIYQTAFDGFPKESDLKLIEEELPPLKDGEFLAEAVYLSVDPYMRSFAPRLITGTTMVGSQVALITDSKNSKFPVGKHVVGQFGWRTHTISDGTATKPWLPPLVLPNFGGLPLSLALGVLGMPGNTAYFGFLDICQPKTGETVIVTGAAGAVGSHVGQIAKIKGCKVIGVAGSDEKGKWLTEELHFDGFINYKKDDVDKVLKEIAPQGIDCFFDNVDGLIFNIIIRNMNTFGRVSVCGAISGYNEKGIPKRTLIEFDHRQQIRIEGFQSSRWADRWMEGIHQNTQWVKEGKLIYRETVTKGFNNMFKAFVGVLKGENIGKAIVEV